MYSQTDKSNPVDRATHTLHKLYIIRRDETNAYTDSPATKEAETVS